MLSVIQSCKINVPSNGGGNSTKSIEIHKYLNCIFEMELKRKFEFLGSLVRTETCKVPLQFRLLSNVFVSTGRKNLLL